MQELVRRRGAHERGVLRLNTVAPALHVRRRAVPKKVPHVYGFTTTRDVLWRVAFERGLRHLYQTKPVTGLPPSLRGDVK